MRDRLVQLPTAIGARPSVQRFPFHSSEKPDIELEPPLVPIATHLAGEMHDTSVNPLFSRT
jgi:hypothetical protein